MPPCASWQGTHDLRRLCAASSPQPPRCAHAVAALCLLLAAAPLAWADTDCRLAFERWAKQSSTSVRAAPQGSSGRGGCIPTEAVRKELLDELARTRTLCAGASVPTDQSLGQIRTLLNINRAFIASLAVCDADAADVGPGWDTKSAPIPEKPLIAAPPPVPPKPVVVAPPPAPPKPVVTAQPPTPPCIEVSPAKDETYALINRRCRGHTVLAVIEMRSAEGETTCRGYTITQSLAVRTARDVPPRVNHECIATQGPCNKDRLGNMFPECDWE